jgi:hypothetical protein
MMHTVEVPDDRNVEPVLRCTENVLRLFARWSVSPCALPVSARKIWEQLTPEDRELLEVACAQLAAERLIYVLAPTVLDPAFVGLTDRGRALVEQRRVRYLNPAAPTVQGRA